MFRIFPWIFRIYHSFKMQNTSILLGESIFKKYYGARALPHALTSRNLWSIRHIELRNLRWRSGVSFLVILEHFLKTSDIFRSTCRMMTIERALDSPDPNACFKYPERIHIMPRKFSTALWSRERPFKKWRSSEYSASFWTKLNFILTKSTIGCV